MKLQRRDVLFLLGSIVLLTLNRQNIRDLIAYASDWDHENASQVLLIPFISGALLFLNRKEIFRNVGYAVLPGTLAIILGLALPIVVRTYSSPRPPCYKIQVDDVLKILVGKEAARSQDKTLVRPDGRISTPLIADIKARGLTAVELEQKIDEQLVQNNTAPNVTVTVDSLNAGDSLSLTTASILVIWIGGFLLVYGLPAFRIALFPLLFLGFAAPIPSVILEPTITLLQRGSAEISYVLLKLSGTPIYREGFVFRLAHLDIIVARECSGIRSGISIFILSLLAGNMLLKTQWRRLALVLVAIPIMIFKNSVRIATLALLGVYVDPSILESRLHEEGGILFFVLALLLIYPFLAALIKSERKTQALKPPAAPLLHEVDL